MATSYTSLLGLALPATGELSGTWGDTVNNYISAYLDSAVAGTQTISGTQTAVTLSVTNGSSLTQAGSGATGSSQYTVINCTGAPASLLTITAPAASKSYLIINSTSTSQSVKIVGSGPTTGVTLVSSERAIVAWNGSDFVKVASTSASTINSGTLAAAYGGTGINSLGTGVATFLGTPSSANLAAAVTDETGSGSLVFATSPTFVTPILGTPQSGNFSSGTFTWPTFNQNTTGTAAGLSATLAVGSGGTGQTTYADGQLLIGNSTGNTLTKATLTPGTGVTITNGSGTITIAATGTGGTVTSVAQSFTGGIVSVAGSPITTSGTLGLTVAGTSGGIPYFSSGTTWASSAALAQYGIVYGGGAGAAPVATAAGTTGQSLLATTSAAPSWGQVSLTAGVTGTLPVANGGTGLSTAPANGALDIGNGTGFTRTTLTAGTGVTITNSAGGISIAAAGSGGTVTSVTGSGNIASSGGTTPNITFTGTLAVGNGGTGVTSSTGSGSVVLSTSPSLTTPVLGTPTSGTLSNCTVDGTDSVGFRNIPQNAQTGSYTLVIADSGKHIYRGSGGAATWTIPANSSVAYAIGTAITFINLSATSVSIAITTDTMYLSSAGTTGTRTLAQYGSATAIKITSTSWVISGSGLT
jgi:hypothetical protein